MYLKKHTKHIIYTSIGIIIFLILYTLKNTNYFLRASTFVFSIILFFVVDAFFNFDFKIHHYIIFILIAIVGIIFSPLYFISPNFDKVLHFINPVLLCILVFYLVNKVDIRFSTKLMITFSFMITFLALFEVGEFILDKLFDLSLQGVFIRDISGIEKLNIVMDRNDDTMIDMILGTIGALIFIGIKTTEFYYKKLILKQKVK